MSSVPREPFKNCYVFLLDGGRYDVFLELLAAHRLPNIQKFLVEPGVVRPAVSTFPSTTGPAHVPFLTGQFAGTSGVVGYRWLDRRKGATSDFHPFKHRSYNSLATLLFKHDMNQRCVTLYELFEKPALVFGPVDLCRNKPLRKMLWRRVAAIGRGHYTGDWERTDRLSEKMTLSYIDAGCDFVFSVFYGVDEYSHLFSPHHELTLKSYERMDAAIGKAVARLRARGELDRSLLVLVSDHGHTATDTHIPVVDEVKRHGFRPLYYPKTLVRDYDAAVMESGNSMCMLYFFLDGDPRRRTTDEEILADARGRELLGRFVEHEGVSFVATRRSDGSIVLRAPGGEVRFAKANGTFDVRFTGRYFLGTAPDPGSSRVAAQGGPRQAGGPVAGAPVAGAPVAAMPIADGAYTDSELFLRTMTTSYPDLMAQYWSLFSSDRCGDLVLSAEPGFDLRWQHEHPEHHSSHGSIHRDHMLTPFAMNAALASFDPLRTADVFPLICRLCGKHLPGDIDIDGRPID